MVSTLRIEPFLLDDESLLGSCGTGSGFVCVTDLRILRVERTWLGRRIRDLSYREVSSVVVADRLEMRAIVAGLLVVLLGLLVNKIAPGLLSTLDPTRPLRLTTEGEASLGVARLALVVLGLALIVAGVLLRKSYVGLEGPFLLRDGGERAQWRFATPTPSDARIFAGLVRQRLALRGVPDRNKVLPFEPY